MDQSRGSPSHPVRSLPLNSCFIPGGSGGAKMGGKMSAARAGMPMKRPSATQMLMERRTILAGKGKHDCFLEDAMAFDFS